MLFLTPNKQCQNIEGQNVCKMTYLVSGGMQNLNTINQSMHTAEFVALNTKWIISQTCFPANLLAWYYKTKDKKTLVGLNLTHSQVYELLIRVCTITVY